MRRFGKIAWDGATRWVEVRGDGSADVLSGEPGSPMLPGQRVLAPQVASLRWLAPCEASKVVGLGYNYKSLVGARDRYDEPLVFLKSPTSLCGEGAQVTYPDFATKVWVEVELGIVIKRPCRNVSVDEAEACILGYTIGSDITAENIHGRDWHLARSKALDGFAPLGPWLVTDVETSALGLSSWINGRQFQSGTTSDRILNDREVVSVVSRYCTLAPGDVILTGTPAGARDSVVRPGDVVRHRIEQLGELTFSIEGPR